MKKFASTILLLVSLIFAEQTTAQTNQWRPVSGDQKDNISGMALLEHNDKRTVFLVVNDNKKPKQNRAAILSIDGRAAPKYAPLRWLGDDLPIDLEAVTNVPGAPNNFMALTSAGRVFHIELSRANNSVKVLKSFDVPQIPKQSEFEGFALQKVNDVLLAIWAERGLDAQPARLFWSRFDLKNYAFTEINSTDFKVPYTAENTRHVSDLKVDESGALFVTSASDPSDDGPFASAFYFAGTFNFASAQKVIFIRTPRLTRLLNFDYRKIEAFEFVPGASGGVAFGTDDENFGASIRLDW